MAQNNAYLMERELRSSEEGLGVCFEREQGDRKFIPGP